MSLFAKELEKRQAGLELEGRAWFFVAYDQLTDKLEPLVSLAPQDRAIVLIETTWKGRRRPYHKQKLAMILANQRQFALEQAALGTYVRYLFDDRDYGEVLEEVVAEVGPLTAMEPAERELRVVLEPLIKGDRLTLVPHGGWLTTSTQFSNSQGSAPPWRMDSFYRHIRRESGILMQGGKPLGGQFSFDEDNRRFWSGEPPAPALPVYVPDPITKEVGEIILEHFGDHPGHLDLTTLPATLDDAEASWRWAVEQCMEHFGPFEDAMSTGSRNLFHTRISPLLNVHRLLPSRVVADVEALPIPLNSKEGFIRQVIGWREFVRHVHEQTDGFFALPPTFTHVQGSPTGSSEGEAMPGSPNFLRAQRPLPPAFWGTPSGMNCLDEVVTSVVEEGYSHHITRLMVLSNLAALLDIDPREVTDWFWVMYIDAYDWVVEPNVLGMGTFALADLFTTKPYVSGSNYIAKMSNYCTSCRFDPKKNCPIQSLYWAFLDRHEQTLTDQGRMNLMYGMLRRRSSEKRASDRAVFEVTSALLEAGDSLSPESIQKGVDDM